MGFTNGASLADSGLGGLGQMAGCSGPVSSFSVGDRLGPRLPEALPRRALEKVHKLARC